MTQFGKQRSFQPPFPRPPHVEVVIAEQVQAAVDHQWRPVGVPACPVRAPRVRPPGRRSPGRRACGMSSSSSGTSAERQHVGRVVLVPIGAVQLAPSASSTSRTAFPNRRCAGQAQFAPAAQLVHRWGSQRAGPLHVEFKHRRVDPRRRAFCARSARRPRRCAAPAGGAPRPSA